jgi:hypothetical protein
MLDVRVLAYVSPLAEQVLDDLTPSVLVQNFADEDAIITGTIRIYRRSTDQRVYTSELATTTLNHGTYATIPALTAWSPGAPADDYYCLADILATSFLPGPPIRSTLGAWTFAIKPGPMGPAPAAHAATHELGGMDEVDLTDLQGILAEPQTPTTHHLEHESGGTDEVDHAALTNLTVGEPHTQYRLRNRAYFADDCLGANNTNQAPWLNGAIAVGTLSAVAGTPNHPGIVRVTSSTSANSGQYILVGTSTLLISGQCRTDCVLRPQTLAGTTIRFGLHDTASSTAPIDGAYLYMDPITGLITGRTMNNSANSVTGTSFQAVTNTWYRLRVLINADASRVDFYCYDEAGNQLWTDNITTNIPTAAGRETGCGIVATNGGTSAVALVDVDLIELELDRPLVR